jgi:tetratricopeptide (TPR) repeat protein
MSGRFVCSTLLALLPFAFCAPAHGQGNRGGAPAGVASTPQPPSSISRPDSIQDSGLYGFWTGMTNQGRAGGALLGKVNIEGEPLVWEPIEVSIVCHEKIVDTTATNAKGEFAFTSVPGAMNKIEADYEQQMYTQYEGCGVSASLPGFRSDTVTITQRNLRDDPNLGTIILRPSNDEIGSAVSNTTTNAPKKAQDLFHKAYAAMLNGNPKRAQDDLEKTVRTDPGFAEAWYELGRLQMGQDNSAAEKSFSTAASADPQFVSPYVQLATLAFAQQRWPDVVSNVKQVLRLDPQGSARIWYFNALANYQLGKVDIAKESAQKSLAMDPRHTIMNTEQLLAVILARQGDYTDAIAHLRSCLKFLPKGPNTDLVNQQIAQLEQAVARQKQANR